MKKQQEKTKRKMPKWLRFILDKFWFILAGLALALGTAYAIKGCASKGTAKASALNAHPKKALEAGDVISVIKEQPVTTYVYVEDVNDGGYIRQKSITTYISIDLVYDGNSTNNVNSYSYESVKFEIVCTGAGLTQWTWSETNYNWRGQTLNNYYIGMGAFYSRSDGSLNAGLHESQMALYTVNPTRAGVLTFNEAYDYRVSGSAWSDNGYDGTDFDYWLRQNVYYDGSYWGLPDDWDFADTWLFQYVVEEERLVNLADAYNSGYMQGYINGIRHVEENPHDYDLYTDLEYRNHYDDGYNAGYAQATLEVSQASIPNLIYTVFNAPMAILNGAFDFELFGVNIANLLKFGLTVGVVIFIVGFFKRK